MSWPAVQERLSTVELLAERGIYPARENTRSVKDQYEYLCPLPGHSDTDPSFRVHADGIRWYCFPCGQGGGPDSLLTLLNGPDLPRPVGAPKTAKPKIRNKPALDGCTLEELAQAKGLDPLWLEREMGWKDVTYRANSQVIPAVLIPYGDQVRYRVGLTGERFRWKPGSRQQLYGLERLADIRTRGWVVLVEGETDTASLTYHDFPVLGVPGKTNWKPAWAGLLEGLSVFLWQEPNARNLPNP